MITYLLFILVYALSCPIHGTTTLTKAGYKPKQDVVRPQEQRRFISKFIENNQQQEAWGLFSYGGFMDDGQIIIYKSQDPIQYDIYHAKPQVMSPLHQDGNFTYKKVSAQLVPNTIQTFNKYIALAQHLENLSYPIFDALRYEYIYLKKKRNQLIIKKRLFINAPEFSDHAKKQNYMNLIKAFKSMALIK